MVRLSNHMWWPVRFAFALMHWRCAIAHMVREPANDTPTNFRTYHG